MYTNQDIGFVQPQQINTVMKRHEIPMGAVFKFNKAITHNGMHNVYLALGNLPSSIDTQCPRVSFMLKPEIRGNVDTFINENTHANTSTSGAMQDAFATFSLSYKRAGEDCTILGGFQFGWHSEEVPAVRTLGTELGRYVSFVNDKIDPDDPESESNLYLSLGASPDFKDATGGLNGDTPILLMKVTDKNRASAYEFVTKGHQAICVTRGVATLKVMK